MNAPLLPTIAILLGCAGLTGCAGFQSLPEIPEQPEGRWAHTWTGQMLYRSGPIVFAGRIMIRMSGETPGERVSEFRMDKGGGAAPLIEIVRVGDRIGFRARDGRRWAGRIGGAPLRLQGWLAMAEALYIHDASGSAPEGIWQFESPGTGPDGSTERFRLVAEADQQPARETDEVPRSIATPAPPAAPASSADLGAVRATPSLTSTVSLMRVQAPAHPGSR